MFYLKYMEDTMIKSWDDWGDIHFSPEQKNRITSAKKSSCTPLSIDITIGNGVFSGSHGIYSTTLSSCECGDFIRRKLPCKHMYRLAMECGLFDGGEIKSDSAAIISPEPTPKERLQIFRDVISVLETYDEEVQNEIREMIYNFNTNRSYICNDIAPFDDAIKRGYIDVIKDNKQAIQSHTQKYTIEKLEETGFAFPEDLKKTKKARYEWCLSHPDIVGEIVYPNVAFLQISGLLKISKKRVYTYLRRKFLDETIYLEDGETSEIPYGSNYSISVGIDGISSLHLDFPDDEITEMLNKYGVNRCVEWNKNH